MESQIDKAIRNNEFVVFLQPKFDTLTKKIKGAESLIRRKIDDKIIMPKDFILDYEKTGEIVKLDMYVLEEVCKLQKDWEEKGYTIIPISVNESRHHLKNPNHYKELGEIIKKYNVNPNNIELEMTETTVIEDIQIAKNAGKEAHKLGFKISMDDFGTGYSAFNVLKDIDIDILKIDRLFFENLEKNKRAQIIIETIVQMCKRLNIETVAEGIETKEQVEFLEQIKCNTIQGYYFSKPLTVEEFGNKFVK